jgi:hypothetical protein
VAGLQTGSFSFPSFLLSKKSSSRHPEGDRQGFPKDLNVHPGSQLDLGYPFLMIPDI